MRASLMTAWTTLAATSGACAAQSADLILHGGPVHTVDEEMRVAEAVAVRDGRVTAVGDAGEILAAHRGSGTRVVDLEGNALYPGFADAHLHLLGIGLARMRVDLVGTASYAEVVERAAAAAARWPSGTWIEGRGWDQNDWEDPAFPTHERLSAAVPDHPVVLTRVDGHALLANRAAMEAAGITAQTPDPPGGRILRDADGRPTGVFVDAAMAWVSRVVPEPTAEQRAEALDLALEVLHRNGITAAHDAGVGAETIALYRERAAAGALPLRLHVMLDGGDRALVDEWFARGPAADLAGDGVLAVRAIKLYADGALGSRGAALLRGYSDEPEHRGLLLAKPEHLERMATEAARAGFQTCIHAIGDRANRLVLDAFAAARAAVLEAGGDADDLRFRVEHAQVLHADDVARFARLGVIPSMQAQHQTSDMPWAEARLGPERVRGAYAWRALLDTGVPIAGGSDAPVERVDPIAAFRAAIARQTQQGEPPEGWHAEQAMTRAEALRHLTVWPAWAAFREDDLGRIAPGMRADFTVLDADLMQVPVAELAGVQVVETWFDGERVWARADGASEAEAAQAADAPR